jgi:spore coat protein CotH
MAPPANRCSMIPGCASLLRDAQSNAVLSISAGIIDPLGSLSMERLVIKLGLPTVFLTALLLSSVARPAATDELDAAKLFDSSRLVNIEVEIAEADWAALCKQTRGGGGFDMASLVSDTPQSPFTNFKANITVDGIRIPEVGIRKKGFIGSLDDVRPSLKITFSEYTAQKPIAGVDGLTLNNNKQDSAIVSQFLSYKVFNAAGVHAPRCNFARVTVNGNYLGVYSNVESYRKPFLQDRFGDDSGDLYEGTLTDFYPRTVQRLELKTKRKDENRKDATRLAQLLASSDDLPLDEVNQLVNIDAFLKFWAVESLLGFWDGYSQNQNNFFVYDNPSDGRFYFMPWGADSCFTSGGGPFAMFGGGGKRSLSVQANAMLCNRLFHADGIAPRYKQTMLDVLDKAWNEQSLIAEVDRIEKLVDGRLHSLQTAQDRDGPWGKPQTMDGIRDFIRARRAAIASELNEWPVEVPAQPQRPMYAVEVGLVTAAFVTDWEENADPLADEGDSEATRTEVQLSLGGQAVKLTGIMVAAHPWKPVGFFGGGGPGQAQWKPPANITINAVRQTDNLPIAITLTIDRDTLATAAGKAIHVSGSFTEGQPSGFGFGPGGKSIDGTLHLRSSGTIDGDTIEGSLDARIIELHGGMMDRMGDRR